MLINWKATADCVVMARKDVSQLLGTFSHYPEMSCIGSGLSSLSPPSTFGKMSLDV